MYCTEVLSVLWLRVNEKFSHIGGSCPLAMPAKKYGHGITEPCGESGLDLTSEQLSEVSKKRWAATLIPKSQK